MPANSTPRDAVAERLPPYAEEAEWGVLGSALLDPVRVIDKSIESQLVPESFYIRSHQMLFETLVSMNRENRPVDILTVSDRLRAANKLDDVGGMPALERLIDSTPTAAHADYYISIVRQKHVLREIIDEARLAIEMCYSSEEAAEQTLAKVEQSIFEISNNQRSEMVPWDNLVKNAMDEIEVIYKSKKGFTGIPTGFTDIDSKLQGLKNSEMIILAARPSMGKTSLALNIAENVATGRNHEDAEPRPVAVFSLEMSAEQLVRRMLCSNARVPASKLTGGYIGEVNHGELVQAADALTKAPIFLDDAAGIEALELRARARRLKRRYDIQLIVIDYLQLLNFSQYAREGRQRETAAISGAMKGMAKELNIPVIVLSQLSRAPETRDRHAVPKLSDLRDSGSIEQDADVVLLLRRPSRIKGDEREHDRTLAIIDVAKNRNGPCGSVELNFAEDYTRFDNRIRSGVDGHHMEEEGAFEDE